MTIYEILKQLKDIIIASGVNLDVKIDIAQADIDTILSTNKGGDTIFINCNSLSAVTRYDEANGVIMSPIFDFIIVSKTLNSDGFPELLTNETEKVFSALSGKFGRVSNILFQKYSGSYYYAKFLLNYI